MLQLNYKDQLGVTIARKVQPIDRMFQIGIGGLLTDLN